MSSVHRVSSEVIWSPSRVCNFQKTETILEGQRQMNMRKGERTDLEVLPVSVYFRHEVLDVFERLLDVFSGLLRQVILYPPGIRPIRLQERQVRLSAPSDDHE